MARKVQERTEVTRQKILKAAKQLFTERGFAGAAMGKIAEKAGVNHSLLFHHFGNKTQLWTAVKQSIVQEASKKHPLIPNAELSWADFVKQLAHNCYHFYTSSKAIQRMIAWQRLEEKQQFLAPPIANQQHPEDGVTLIAAYQERGEVTPSLDPKYIASMIYSLTSSVALDPNRFVPNETARQAYLDFCIESIVKATTAAKS